MPVRNIQLLMLVALVCTPCYFYAKQLRYAGQIGTAIELIERGYVEERDAEDLYHAAMEGLVKDLDPYSQFIPPTNYEKFQAEIEQTFGGIGIMIEGPPVADQLTIVTPIPGTPAFEAGLRPGDVITKIDDQPTEGKSIEDAQKLMRGPIGSSITLEISRNPIGQRLTKVIQRANVQVASVYGDRITSDSSWDFFLEEDSRIGYIRVSIFGERTLAEFADALEKTKDAKALIIDLRSNPGGLMPTAISMCDMLVEQGTILTTKGRLESNSTKFEATSGTKFPINTPIIVMVNEDSASASEIMAGCLQDLQRAKIAGQRSFGKGTVQEVIELRRNSSAIKFTTARFYRPSGRNIHRTEKMTAEDVWGIKPEPNLSIELTPLQQFYLAKRFRDRNDPRETTRKERPPAPECAGDPQLRIVLEYFRQLLDDRPHLNESSTSTEPEKTTTQ